MHAAVAYCLLPYITATAAANRLFLCTVQEARVQRVLERAAAPAFKRIGRTKMVRSMPAPRRQARVASKEADDAEQELQAYLSAGAYEGTDGSHGLLTVSLAGGPDTAAESNSGS